MKWKSTKTNMKHEWLEAANQQWASAILQSELLSETIWRRGENHDFYQFDFYQIVPMEFIIAFFSDNYIEKCLTVISKLRSLHSLTVIFGTMIFSIVINFCNFHEKKACSYYNIYLES